MQTFQNFMVYIGETSFWAMILQLQHTLPCFKLLCPLVVAISYSPLHSPLLILILYSIGVSIASIKTIKMLVIQLYSLATSYISSPMAANLGIISSECSRKVTALSNGFSTTLDFIQELHIALHGAFSAVKKSLSLNIQMVISRQSTQELL